MTRKSTAADLGGVARAMYTTHGGDNGVLSLGQLDDDGNVVGHMFLTEAAIDDLLALLAQRPAMRDKAALAPKLRWVKHAAWDKVYQAEMPNQGGTYVIEPIWNFDKERVISGYSVSFVPQRLSEVDALMADGTKASDLFGAVSLGTRGVSLGSRVGRSEQGELKFVDAKYMAQAHFQRLHEGTCTAA